MYTTLPLCLCSKNSNHKAQYSICGVMVSVLSLCAIDRGFKPLSGQAKDYTIDISCFFAKYTVVRRKSKDWLAVDQYNICSIKKKERRLVG